MSRERSVALALLCASAALGCEVREVELAPGLDAAARDGTASGSEIPGLLALRITPGAIEVTYDGSALGDTPRFSAIGSFADGERDVTDRVQWSLGKTELGAIERGRFETAAIGGLTSVDARAGPLTASAELRVKLEILLNPAGLSDAELARFAQDDGVEPDAQPGQAALRLLYPADDTLLPSNLAHLRVQWQAPEALDRFELRFESAFSRLRYYTDQRSWLDDADSSRYLAPSHAGETLTLTVRALASSEPATLYRSQSPRLRVSQGSIPGAAYYWSTTARGIKRGHLAASTASWIAGETAAGGQRCAGCHALSRDGTLLAVSNESERLAIIALPEQTERSFGPAPPPAAAPMPGMPMPSMPMPGMPMPGMPMPGMAAKPPKKDPKPTDYGWGSFNPAGTRLVYADKGKLHLLDAVSGEELGRVELPPDALATHPDWAPDGRAVAVSYSPAGKKQPGNKQLQGTSIARLSVRDDGSLAAPEIVVGSTGPDDTLLYPSYAPDGRWLAFVRTSGLAKDNPSSEIYLVAADGSTPPVLLERLNRSVGTETDVGQIANAMPTWAPTLEPNLGFISFSSTRDYGEVSVGGQRDQLWAAAIDFTQLAAAVDPSAPAFWLPFQDPTESNHRALWPASLAGVCPSLRELCDGRDDDCDGEIDEDCCTPSAELCGDGLDNDCDGVADEGCDCALEDACGDKLDTDCDLAIDEDC